MEDERVLTDVEWEAELRAAMAELRRSEYRRQKLLAARRVNPWVI